MLLCVSIKKIYIGLFKNKVLCFLNIEAESVYFCAVRVQCSVVKITTCESAISIWANSVNIDTF